MTVTIFEIAGGNRTVLQAVYGQGGKSISKQMGRALLARYPAAEQAGFVTMQNSRLEMAGGEFCGNATAAAAVLFAHEPSQSTVRYRVSGFAGTIVAEVTPHSDDRYTVRTLFQGMHYTITTRYYAGWQVDLVDMKGIIHVLIEDAFPADYEQLHHELVDALNLRDCEAVGVIWYQRKDKKVYINPVVWVRNVDTLYYESACGSGAIAASVCTSCNDIVQPTGQSIYVLIDKVRITTECEVAIIS